MCCGSWSGDRIPGILKVPGSNAALAVGDGLGAVGDTLSYFDKLNERDFEQTGGVDLIPVPPNGILAKKRVSGTYHSEEDLIRAAMKRVGQETGCDVGQVLPIWGPPGKLGVRPIEGYLMLTNCK